MHLGCLICILSDCRRICKSVPIPKCTPPQKWLWQMQTLAGRQPAICITPTRSNSCHSNYSFASWPTSPLWNWSCFELIILPFLVTVSAAAVNVVHGLAQRVYFSLQLEPNNCLKMQTNVPGLLEMAWSTQLKCQRLHLSWHGGRWLVLVQDPAEAFSKGPLTCQHLQLGLYVTLNHLSLPE